MKKPELLIPAGNLEKLETAYLYGADAYGYRDDNELLISKVGFTKDSEEKFELDVCVHPDFQGKGIGQKIIQQSIEKFLSENHDLNVFLKVHPENPALRLYEKVGFEAHKNDDDNYKINTTDHGPRITMDYINN